MNIRKYSTLVKYNLTKQPTKFIKWAGLNPLAGQFGPACCMFDTPV